MWAYNYIMFSFSTNTVGWAINKTVEILKEINTGGKTSLQGKIFSLILKGVGEYLKFLKSDKNQGMHLRMIFNAIKN